MCKPSTFFVQRGARCSTCTLVGEYRYNSNFVEDIILQLKCSPATIYSFQPIRVFPFVFPLPPSPHCPAPPLEYMLVC